MVANLNSFRISLIAEAFGLLGAALACSGCGAGVELAPVRGQVLLDGRPLQFGAVMFQPAAGQPAAAVIKPDGTFEMNTPGIGNGAAVGPNEVRVTCYEAQNPAAKPGRFGEGLGRLLIPAHYTSYGTSGLVVDVPPRGLDDFVLELTSH